MSTPQKGAPTSQWRGSKPGSVPVLAYPEQDPTSGVWGFSTMPSDTAFTSDASGVFGVDTAPEGAKLQIVNLANGLTLVF